MEFTTQPATQPNPLLLQPGQFILVPAGEIDFYTQDPESPPFETFQFPKREKTEETGKYEEPYFAGQIAVPQKKETSQNFLKKVVFIPRKIKFTKNLGLISKSEAKEEKVDKEKIIAPKSQKEKIVQGLIGLSLASTLALAGYFTYSFFQGRKEVAEIRQEIPKEEGFAQYLLPQPPLRSESGFYPLISPPD